jgi:hypothetical protein
MQAIEVAMSHPRKMPRARMSLLSPWQLELRPLLCSMMGSTSLLNETTGVVRSASDT